MAVTSATHASGSRSVLQQTSPLSEDVVSFNPWPEGDPMNRRDFIGPIGGPAAWPLAASGYGQ